MKVSKFGGSSLADANQIKKAIAIIQADPERAYIVVSAPGKRNLLDEKITDLFSDWHKGDQTSAKQAKDIILARYSEIVSELGISFDLTEELAEIEFKIDQGASKDYAISRGEYLNGKIMALALNFDFVDAESCIFFYGDGKPIKNDPKIREIIQGRRVVIPGFYGIAPSGEVKTFSRGGSDITGAIIARAVGAKLYENWTDVSGLLMADPRVVHQPKQIHSITYRELRELTYMGANVFHEEAMFPVQEAGITTNIRNTNNPNDSGTYIVNRKDTDHDKGSIVGLAGRKNFTVITIEKIMMNQQVGFVRRMLTVLEENEISFEHMPSGIDTLSIIIDDKQLNGKLEKIVRQIKLECLPDTLEVYPNMAMIAVVGRTMVHVPGMAAKIFTAVANEKINIRMINQGSSEISIILGVENDDYENTVRAIYKTFVSKGVCLF